MVEKKKRQEEAELDRIKKEKNLITVNGMLQVSKNELEKHIGGFNISEIPNFDKLEKEKVNPLEPVVKKIEERGFTLEMAFSLLDDNCDEILTIQEITTGLKNIGVDLTNEEYKELVKSIDRNGDGVLTLEEFVQTMQPR